MGIGLNEEVERQWNLVHLVSEKMFFDVGGHSDLRSVSGAPGIYLTHENDIETYR